jgi:hypothetical protein
MAKGKKVMFVFILEVLDRDRPQPGPFWEVPKKHCCCPHVPKKSEVSPSGTLPTPALFKAEEYAMEDTMEVVEPTSHTDSASPRPLLSTANEPPYVPSDRAVTFLSLHPFPPVLDHQRIVSWGSDVIQNEVPFNKIPEIAEHAGHDFFNFLLLYAELIPHITHTLPPP